MMYPFAPYELRREAANIKVGYRRYIRKLGECEKKIKCSTWSFMVFLVFCIYQTAKNRCLSFIVFTRHISIKIRIMQ